MIPTAPLHSPHAPWVHLFMTEEGQEGEGLPLELPEFKIITLDGHRCETKQSLLSEYARAFEFPAYFGDNWDAFEECLSDLEWIPAKGYVTLLRHGERVLYKQEEEFTTYINILQSIGQEWSRPQQDSLHQVSLPFHTLFLVSREHYSDRHDWQVPILDPPTP